MFEDTDRLLSEDARIVFRDDFRALLRRGDATAAEALVQAHIRPEGLLGALCASLRAEAVRLDGWDVLTEMVRWHSAEGMAIIALGIDLTANIEGAQDARGCAEPGLETRYYTANSAPELVGVRADLEAMMAAEPGCWQSGAESYENDVTVHGLAGLYTALVDASRGELAATEGDLLIGWATLSLRLYQAMIRGAEAAALPQGLIFISGENEWDGAGIAASGLYILGESAAPYVAPLAAPPSDAMLPGPEPLAPRPALQAPLRRAPGGFGRKGL